MPTRKQRRRRQKDRRHEYEYVYVDDEGNEVEVAPDELPAERRASTNGRTRQRARATNRPAIPPPSWRRVGKRGLIFAPLMFITVMLLDDKGVGVVGWLLQTALLLGVFLPFSYFVDTYMYRRYLRRTGTDPDGPKRA